jgi:hypothetical protein
VEQSYTYDVRLMGQALKGGKLVLRELTDEEKLEAEALKSKEYPLFIRVIDKKPGGPPGKDDKAKKPEEMPAEEKEKIEREARLKEEKEAEFSKWWESQTEQERFQLYFEDRFREPKVYFASQAAPTPDVSSPRQSEPGSLDITLSGAELQKFEKEVYEQKGIWIYFDKLPPAEEDAAAKGAKPPAGKAGGAKPGLGAGEELKPVNGKVWLDLTVLTDPSQPPSLFKERFLVQTVTK